ncbi:MAG: methyltransferase domain-containing protein [Caulobacter sp.]|nr:methyltransferase domain-containing protein [Caulobacter sp.]
MPDAEPANADQIAYWNAAAGETWAAQQEKLDRQIAPLGEAAMAILDPKPGEQLIDIGCGCGQTSLTLAERVGPTGRVLGVDISAPMLAVARRRAADAGLANTRFLEADAQTHDFAPGAADAVFSRFGVMFFADPPAAFANIRKALKPGGRLAFVCWRPLALNEWMLLPMRTALAHIPAPPPGDPFAPGPFAFSDPDWVRGILGSAGFKDVEIAPHDAMIGGNGLEETVALSLKVGPLGALLRDNPDKRDLVVDALRAALAPHAGPDGVRLPGAVWIVTAR